MILPDGLTGEPTLKLQELLGLLELERLRQKQSSTTVTAARFYDDPLGFVDTCIKFPLKGPRRGPKVPGGLASYQREIIGDLAVKQRLAVRGPRGLGKTAIASIVVLWFALTRDMAGVDWKVMTTAGSWQQLTAYLWPEIRKWSRYLDWDLVGRRPFHERDELQKHSLPLRYGAADASSPDNPGKIEGLHAQSLLVLVDEAKLVSPAIFESIEGAFSGAGAESGDEAFALAISTPGEVAGRFYAIHQHAPGLENWSTRHVTLEEAIAAGRMTRKWADQRAKLWGVSSALYQNHVLGEFCSDDEDAIVPLAWAEAGVERWREWDSAGRPEQEGHRIIGVDVAGSGKDHTALAFREGMVITKITTHPRADTMESTGHVAAGLGGRPAWRAMVDVIGVGAGVYDRLKEQGLPAEPFNAARKTSRRDKTNSFGFVNHRAAAWWHLRELLDPSCDAVLAIPPDDELLGDLTALHFKRMSDGKIMVEPKKDVRVRIGRSTDKGDAVIQAMWTTAGSWHDAYGTEQCPRDNCGRSFGRTDAAGKLRTHCPWCHEPLDGPAENEPSEETQAA